MKKNKNFLRKLTAGILGFVMTLGVGAAGYGGAVSEARAGNKTSTLTFTAACSGSGTADDGVSWSIQSDAAESNFDNEKGVHYGTGSKAVSYLKATSASFDCKIKKVVVNCSDANKTATISVTVGGETFGTSQQEKSYNNSAYTFEPTTAQGTNFTGVVIVNMSRTSAKKALYIKKIAVTYEESGSSKTLDSLVVSGTPDKTSYIDGNTFNPAGLVVTGTYKDGSSEEITSDIEWTFDPDPLTAGTTSVDVMASVGNIVSDIYTVNEITVEEKPALDGSYAKYSGALTDGYYLIAGGDTTFMSNDVSSSRITYGTLTVANDKVQVSTLNTSYVWYISSNGTNYTLYNDNVKKYAAATGTKSQAKLSDDGTANESLWSCSNSSSSTTYNFVNVLNTARGVNANFRYNSGYGFACYAASTGPEFTLYKKEIVKQLTSISIDSDPDNKDYAVGDSFDTTGMVVKAHYDDESSETITDYTVDPEIMAANTTSVTIGYQGKTATVTGIDVSNYKGIEVTGITDTNRTFTNGDKFSFSGTVNKVYEHSSKKDDTKIPLSDAELAECTYTLGGEDIDFDTKLSVDDNGKKVVVTYDGSSTTDSTGSYTIIVNYAKPTAVNIVPTLSLGPNADYDFSSKSNFSVSPAGAKQQATFEITKTEGDLVEDEDYIFSDGYIYIDENNHHEGKITVTAYSVDEKAGGGKATGSCEITVSGEEAPELVELRCELDTTYKAKQYITVPLDLTGVTVYAVFTKGDDVDVTTQVEWGDDYEVGDHPYGMYADPLNPDNIQEVEIEEIEFIADSVASITVDASKMSKKSYINGQEFSSEGLTITGTMASGLPAGPLTATSYEFNPSVAATDMTSVDVRATYKVSDLKTLTSEYVTVTGITVEAKSVVSIDLDYSSVDRDFTLGDEFDYDYLQVDANYNDGTKEEDVSDYTVTAPDMFTVNPEAEVVVSYGGKTASYTVNIHAKDVGVSYTLVDDISTLKAGDEIILAATYGTDDSATTYVMSGLAPKTDGYEKYTAVVEGTISGTTISPVSPMTNFDNEVYKIGGTTNAFTLTNSVGQLGCTGAKAMAYGTDISATTWTFGSDKEGEKFSINSNEPPSVTTDYGRILFNYNGGKPRFLNYSSATSDTMIMPSIYKKASSGSYNCIRLEATQPTRVLYAGEKVTVADFAPITALLNDGKEAKTVTEADGVSITSGETLSVGDNTVVLSYLGFDLPVVLKDIPAQTKVVDTITMGVKSGTTAKTEYYVEDGVTPEWDFTNIEITIKYKSSHEDEVLTIPEAMNNYGATVSPEIPTVGTDGFTVSLEVLGVKLGDSGHFSATVVNKAIDGINAFNFNKDELVLNYFENDTYNSAGINSVTLHYNDGDTLNVNKANFAAYGIKIGLVEKTTDTSLAEGSELTDGTALDPKFDGYYLAVSYGNFVKTSLNKISITALLNEVSYVNPDVTPAYKLVTSDSELEDGMQFVIVSTGKVMDALDSSKRYLGAEATIDESNSTVSFDSATIFKLKKNGDNWNIIDGNNAIQFTGTGNQSMSLNVLDTTSSKQQFTISVSDTGTSLITNVEYSDRGLRYNSDLNASYMSNYGKSSQKAISIYKNTAPKTVYSNINMNAQHAVVDYAKWFIQKVTKDASDADWSKAITQYGTLVTNILAGDDLDIAKNLFKYAKADANGDVLQQCVAIYDAYIAKWNYGSDAEKNFLDRDVKGDKYTITLNANEGTCSQETIERMHGEAYGTLPTPEREGFRFDGWYTAKNAGTKIEADSLFNGVDNNTTIYAHWSKLHYVTLDVGEGATGGKLSTYSYVTSDQVQTITITEDPIKTGYTLTGYGISGGSATITGKTITIPAGSYADLTVTAKWKINSYNITLNNDVDSPWKSFSLNYNQELDLSAYSPTKTGYILNGWKDDNTGEVYETDDVITITNSLSLTAQWKAKTYTVTLDTRDGEPVDGYSITATYGQPLGELPTPTKENYIFAGWYTTAGSDSGVLVTKDTIYLNDKNTTYYARWTHVYYVTFNYNAEDASGGTLSATYYVIDKNNDQTITILTDPVREGYTVSYYTVTAANATIEGNVIKIPKGTYGKITINVFWEGDPHKVTLDYNNGSSKVVDVNYGDIFDLSKYSPVKEGYKLTGWIDSDNNSYGINDKITIDGDLSLTAQWEANAYTIKFNGNGGTTPSSMSVTYNEVIGTLPESKQTGYTFAGWFTDPVGGTQVYGTDKYLTADDTTLYAHWQINTHTVTYDGGNSEPRNYNESFTLAEAPTKENYIFVGWECDYNGKVYDAGASFTMPDQDVNFVSVWAKDLSTVKTSTEANFTYYYTVSDGFQKVTGYSLRIYVDMDVDTYNYYKAQGYTFTVNLINGNNHKNMPLTQVYSWYDSSKECYVFQVAFNVPQKQLDTSLTVQMIGNNAEGSVECVSSTTTYNEAAQELYQAYKDGDVDLNLDQVKALEWIISQIPEKE